MSAATLLERPTVEANLGLVHHIARRFRWVLGASLDYEDLVQAGCIGLMKACELFEPERGSRFASYAIPWIWHHVSREALNHGRTVRVPLWVQDKLRQTRGSLLPILRLDAPLSGDGSEGETHLDAVEAPVLDAAAQLEAEETRRALARALERLPARTRGVLDARFWDERLLSDLAGPLEVSSERVRQIEAKGLARLRWLLTKERTVR